MECLDRGVVAVPSEGNVFVSWRLFGTDPDRRRVQPLSKGRRPEESLVCSTGASEATSCVDDEPSAGASYSCGRW